MNNPRTSTSRAAAFTLVEMVGVLSVIAVLAGLLIPKIFASINEARINDAVTGINALQSATVNYVSKYGRIGGIEGAAYASGTTVTDWDKAVLLVERLIDKPFEPRISSSVSIRVSDCSTASTDVTADNNAYNLDNNTTYNKNDAFGSRIVECVLSGMTREDAWELSRRIDGASLSAASKTDPSDLLGRVKYNITGNEGTVRVYLAHR